jgi:hypothetical protein
MFEDHLPPESKKNGYDDPSIGTVIKKSHVMKPVNWQVILRCQGADSFTSITLGGEGTQKSTSVNKCFSKLPPF